jgi:hypothetical protein
MKLYETLQEHGRAQRQCRKIMAQVAIDVARASKRGEVDEDDAADLYATYYRASTGARALKGSDGIKVNASKLRQIIKAADPDLLERVMAMAERVPEGTRASTYAAMVNACRAKLDGRRVTQGLIRKLVSI